MAVTVSFCHNKRMLVRELLYSRGRKKLALVDLTGPSMTISDFQYETANTVFVDGVALLIQKNAFATEEELNDFLSHLRTQSTVNTDWLLQYISEYKKAASEGEAADNVLIVVVSGVSRTI